MFTPYVSEVVMISSTLDGLALAHEHGRRLRADAARERVAGTSRMRLALATFLRRAADRLDTRTLASTPVGQS